MKNFKNKKGRKAALVCLIYLLASASIFAQENPWESKPQGKNPWATEETIQKQESTEGVQSNQVALNSTKTVRHFNINNEIVELNTNSYNYIRTLKRQGKKMHKGNGALGAGIATGALINFYALPVNLIASVIPTNKTIALGRKFEKDNPHATIQEVRAVKRGIRHKRLQKAILGNVIGATVNIIAILIIIN